MKHVAKSKLYKVETERSQIYYKWSRLLRRGQLKLKSFDNKKSIVPYSAEEVLGFILDNTLNKQQYINIRCETEKQNADIYPAYEYVIEEKKTFIPK